jgi:hypothetical protein
MRILNRNRQAIDLLAIGMPGMIDWGRKRAMVERLGRHHLSLRRLFVKDVNEQRLRVEKKSDVIIGIESNEHLAARQLLRGPVCTDLIS